MCYNNKYNKEKRYKMTKNKKRLIMGLGTIGAIMTPVATLISCGSTQKPKPAPKAPIEAVYKFLQDEAKTSFMSLDLGTTTETDYTKLTTGMTIDEFKTTFTKNFIKDYNTAIDKVIAKKIAEATKASDKTRLQSIKNTIDYLVSKKSLTVDSIAYPKGTNTYMLGVSDFEISVNLTLTGVTTPLVLNDITVKSETTPAQNQIVFNKVIANDLKTPNPSVDLSKITFGDTSIVGNIDTALFQIKNNTALNTLILTQLKKGTMYQTLPSTWKTAYATVANNIAPAVVATTDVSALHFLPTPDPLYFETHSITFDPTAQTPTLYPISIHALSTADQNVQIMELANQ